MKRYHMLAYIFILSGWLMLAPQAFPATLPLAQYPLFLNSAVTPNVLVILDNSQSMDGTMAGKLIAGSDPSTRGNTARSIIKGVIDSYRTQFNWGLETFAASGGSSLYNTYAYYLGNSTSMVFTNDCVGGISASNGGRRCIAAPQANNGYSYVTYGVSGDDPTINDVLYTSLNSTGFWAVAPTSGTSTNYNLFNNHNNGTTWNVGDFSSATFGSNPIGFTPTDAGFLPSWPTYTRQVYVPRAWGYYNDITGAGVIKEPAMVDSTTHYNKLAAALAPETNNPASTEIKNGAVYTPLTGAMATALSYFKGSIAGTASPIQYTCQKSFVLLATDGNPTGKTDGSQYLPSQWASATTGQAYLDLYPKITALRSTALSGTNYDIATYVVGMGDSVANPTSIAGLNQMASNGGTGTAYLANNATALTTAFQNIAADIVARTAAASAVSLNSGSWMSGAEVFQAKFNSGDWSGQLLSYPVQADGTLGTLRWDAGQVLNTQAWDAGRQILTYKPSAALGQRGVAFRWPANPASPTANEIDTTQSTSLNTNATGTVDSYGSQRVQYLRGNASNEASVCDTCTPLFRSRPTTKLGDIVDSAPFYVAAPSFVYSDSMESAPYSAFASSYRTRTPVVYVGANDGMLHGFNASSGRELFAYVPNSVYPNLSQLTSTTYNHHYYADGSPTVGDAFYGGAWHTILASGLRAGAQGLFALDVTDPGTFTEANVRNIVRWEFTDANDADLGNLFGQPLIVKTNNGRWSVIVGNGYNSTSADGHASATGHAVLYVIDAQNGTVTAKIDTLSGTAAAPNGLSGPIAVDTNGDNIADVVYAGDLSGNLWKFDISNAAPASWNVAFSGHPLFSTGGQPITTKPDVTVSSHGGYVVAFGTGQYVATTDPASTTAQSFYGIWDNGAAVASLASLQQQSIAGTSVGADGNTYRVSTHAVGPASDALVTGDNAITPTNYYAGKSGWYINLPTSGERATTDASIRGGRVIFNTLVPVTGICTYGGSGWVMELDINTGNRLDNPTFDINGDRTLTSADMVRYGGNQNNATGRMISSIPAAPAFLQPQQNPGKASFENKYINTTSGALSIVGETGGNGAQGRIFWKQIQ